VSLDQPSCVERRRASRTASPRSRRTRARPSPDPSRVVAATPRRVRAGATTRHPDQDLPHPEPPPLCLPSPYTPSADTARLRSVSISHRPQEAQARSVALEADQVCLCMKPAVTVAPRTLLWQLKCKRFCCIWSGFHHGNAKGPDALFSTRTCRRVTTVLPNRAGKTFSPRSNVNGQA